MDGRPAPGGCRTHEEVLGGKVCEEVADSRASRSSAYEDCQDSTKALGKLDRTFLLIGALAGFLGADRIEHSAVMPDRWRDHLTPVLERYGGDRIPVAR